MRDLESLSRKELLALIAELQATVAQLQARLRELEARLEKGGPQEMPEHQPTQAPPKTPQPRKPRPHGFARPRGVPTERMVHVQGRRPDCPPEAGACSLSGAKAFASPNAAERLAAQERFAEPASGRARAPASPAWRTGRRSRST